MKTEKSLRASYEACLKQSIKSSKSINSTLELFKAGMITREKSMHVVREYIEKLNKSIHEMNAYSNALETE